MDDSSAVTSEARGNWNESPSERPHHQRSASYPLRRPHPTGRLGEAVAVAVSVGKDGFPREDAINESEEKNHSYLGIANGNGVSHYTSGVKCSGGSNRRTSVGERGASVPKIWKSSSTVSRILISLVAVFFLIETVSHGFVFILFRHTDLQAESREIFPRVFGTGDATAGDDVRFVPRNVVERLLLSKGRATVAELRKEVRSPVRLPRLALVCFYFFSLCFSLVTRKRLSARAFFRVR